MSAPADFTYDSKDSLPKAWHMEYRNSFPHATVTFTVVAVTFEEAIQKGDKVIFGLQRTGTWIDRDKTYNVRKTYNLLGDK